MKHKKNGFTLIEILITIGLISIVASAVMMFFIVNVNSFAILKNDTELQFQSQYIMNFVSKKIMESKNVEVIKKGTSSVINSKKEYSISKIALRYGDANYNCYIFEVINNKIFYGNSYSDTAANVELGIYVKELKVAPYPTGKTFAQADALRIILCLYNKGQEYEAEQVIYLRNS